MPLYKFTALDQHGGTISGNETAANTGELVARLRSRSQYPISVDEVVEKDVRDMPLFNKVGLKQLSLFARQFAAMLGSGVPIVTALDIMQQQTEHKKFKQTLAQLYEDVQKGNSFSASLARHPEVFPSLMVNMIAAGEASGNLDGISHRVASHYESEFKVSNRVKSAMVYPIILVVLVVVAVIFMLTFVMPTFIGMFEGSGVPLPGVTSMLINMSNFIRAYWYALFGGFAVLAYGVRRYLSTPDGSRVHDRIKLRIPLFWRLTQKEAASRFCRTLATLLASGIPLMQALESVAKAVGNSVLGESILESREEVRRGSTLSAPIRRSAIFPPMVDNMIKIGEESGTLDDMLDKAADFFDEEVETEVQRLLSFMEPALIIIMAAVVGFVVIAMMLPMFDMLQTIQ